MREPVRPLRFVDDALELLDQTKLPNEELWIRLTEPDEVIEAIGMLRVRGAPAIGVAGAYAVVLAAGAADDVRAAAPRIAAARPTAVNLGWAVDRMLRRLDDAPSDAPRSALLEEARAIHAEDEASSQAIGSNASRPPPFSPTRRSGVARRSGWWTRSA